MLVNYCYPRKNSGALSKVTQATLMSSSQGKRTLSRQFLANIKRQNDFQSSKSVFYFYAKEEVKGNTRSALNRNGTGTES